MVSIFIKIDNIEMYHAIEKMHDEGIVDRCVALVSGRYDMIHDSDWVYVLNEAPVSAGEYEVYENENDWEPIDVNKWKKYCYYESFVSCMGARFHNFPITIFEEQERIFINGIRFWEYIFEKYSINVFIYTGAVPHEAGVYIGYCVAKERGCKVLLSTSCEITERYFFTDSADDFSTSIEEYYHDLLKKDNEIVLDHDMQQYYEMKKKQFADDDEFSTPKPPNMLSIRKRWGWRSYFRKQYVRARYYGFCLKYGKNNYRYAAFKRDMRNEQLYLPVIRAFGRRFMAGDRFYKSLAIDPNDEEQYILYLLQYTPEESTLPRAGIYHNQLLAIQLLSYVANENGIKVYVKEHYYQPCRDKQFYSSVVRLNNVRLINKSIKTEYLIKNSLAVSTCTGTCILESVMMNKPIIAFGRGQVYKGLNSMFCIETIEECQNALKIIISKEYQTDDFRTYLYAIQNTTYKIADADQERDASFWYELLVRHIV